MSHDFKTADYWRGRRDAENEIRPERSDGDGCCCCCCLMMMLAIFSAMFLGCVIWLGSVI